MQYDFHWDTETYPIRPGLQAPKMVCLSWADSHTGESGVLPAWTGEALDLLAERLDDPECHLVGHNIAFDCGVAARYDADFSDKPRGILAKIFRAGDEDRLHCTQTREKLIELALGNLEFKTLPTGKTIKQSYSMMAIAKQRFGVDLSAEKSNPLESWRLRYNELDGVPLDQWPAEAHDYAEDDALRTGRIYDAQGDVVWCQAGQVAGPAGVQNEADQVRASIWLYLTSCWGLKTDPVAVAKLKAEIEEEVDRVHAKLKGLGIYRKSGSKNLTVLRDHIVRAYATNHHKAPPKTKSGLVSTSSSTLEKSGDPLLMELASVSSLEKLLSSFIPDLERGTVYPLTPRYDPLKETGRTSSYSPNIQQMPRKGGVRECFVPRDGYVFCSIDYDTLELACLAQVNLKLFGWSKMADAINSGRDLHLDFAVQLIGGGLTYEEALVAKNNRDHPLHDKVMFNRQLAKAANFGFPGGLVARTFVQYAKGYGVKDLTEEKAQALRSQWLTTWAEMELYFDRIGAEVGFGDSTTIVQLGSKRYRGDVGYTAACNGNFQGLAADGAKEAGWQLSKHCYVKPKSALYGSRIVAFIHDEFMFEMPIDRAPEAAAQAQGIMVAGMEKFVPDVRISCEPALMDRWYKGAEAVYDEDGKLTLWQPRKSA